MPTLEFKGKPFVYSHHLSVPFRELVIDPKKSLPAKGQKPSLDDNLIIHGDNLEALKALLPRYAGKVDVIYIDPPYNTGNEGWAYNDNVNSPLMKEWLGKVVDRDDLERHDKWLCMMWPRLQLLKELLADEGSVWISCDDNESHQLRVVMDELFGEENFVAQVAWQKRYTRSNNTDDFTTVIEYIVVYGGGGFSPSLLPRDEAANERFTNPDNDPRGPWKATPFLNMVSPERRPNLVYPITNPHTRQTSMPEKKAWRYERDVFERLQSEDRLYWGKNNDRAVPDIKTFLSEVRQGMTPINFFSYEVAGHTDDANREIKDIFGEKIFDTPKPSKLIRHILLHAGKPGAVVLDSFAGSGTTAHAVLAANQQDNGNRRFIVVETEKYADSLTAERVRRVIKGVPSAKDEALKKGLRGSFTFCELGEPLGLDRFFDGKGAPSYEQVGRYVVYTATGQSIPDVPAEPRKDWFVGEAGGYRIHLIYKPDLAFMRGNDAALSMPLAEKIAKGAKGKPVLVYAAAKFMSQNELTKKGVTFCQLPYSVHRVLGEAPDV